MKRQAQLGWASFSVIKRGIRRGIQVALWRSHLSLKSSFRWTHQQHPAGMSPACRANRLTSSTGLRTQLSPADQSAASTTTSKIPAVRDCAGQSGRRQELALSPNANDCGRTMIPMGPSHEPALEQHKHQHSPIPCTQRSLRQTLGYSTKACCANGLPLSNSSCRHPNDRGTG